MRVLLAAVVCGLLEEIRESLPDDERTAGAWVAGLAWGCAINWTLLVLITLHWSLTR